MSEVTVFGDCFQDLLFEIGDGDADIEFDRKEKKNELCFEFGQKIDAKTFTKTLGGNAYNVSIGFARLGLESKIFSIVGEDAAGREIKSSLEQEHVNVKDLTLSGKTNTSSILVYKHERSITSYHEQRNYKGLDLRELDWIYFTSAVSGCEKLLPKIMTKKKVFVFNPGSWQLSNFKFFEPYLVHTDILIVNKQEAQTLSKKNGVNEALKRFAKLGIKLSIITDGANGAYIGDSENLYHAHIYPTNAVDSTGAGDAFASGLVAGLIRGKTILDSIKWGIINSSSVVEKFGATEGLLELKEIEKREANWKSFTVKPIRG